MTVSPISSSSLSSVQAAGNQFHQARAKVLSSVAGKLNMSVDQLTSQLSAGKSLADVAKANGMSDQDLKATVTSALQQAGAPTGADVNAIADRMINHVGGRHHHHHDAAPPAAATTPPTPSPAAAGSSGSDLRGTTTDLTI
jgi:DNA-binding phage protein